MAFAQGRCTAIVGQGCTGKELRRHREIPVKILLLGAGGQVGRALIGTLPDRHQVIAYTRADLDIADEHAVERALADVGADWMVNAAAYTAVDLAEDEAD